MKIIICGAGQVGYSLAKYLSQEDNDVTIIDQSHEIIEQLGQQLDVQTVVGHPCQPDIMKIAGTGKADLVIAVTGSDEINMVACEVAHTIFGVPTKIARIRDQSYLNPEWKTLFSARNIGIDYIISPELEISKAVERNIQVSGAFEVHALANGKIMLVGIKALSDSLLLHTPLRLLSTVLTNIEFNVVLITRQGQVIFPQGDDVVLAGDEIYFVASPQDVNTVIQSLGYHIEPFKRVVIIGGGHVGMGLGTLLNEHVSNVKTKIIESDKKRAQFLSSSLQNAVVIQGNAMDTEILQEASVGNAEIVVSVTNDDKVNILVSLLAKKIGAKRTLALINSTSYNSLISSLGVDGVIHPKSITISSILHHLRHGRVKSVHSLGDGAAEIIEAEVSDSSPIAGCFVRKVNVPGVMHVIGLIREGQVILTTDNLSVRIADRVIMIVSPHSIKRAEKLFTSKAEYIF